MIKLILLLILLAKLSLGQTHFIDSTSHWHENAQFHSSWAPDSVHFQDYVYYFNGDSIVSSNQYFQMFRIGTDSIVSVSYPGYNIVPIDERIGLIREDSNSSKVYFIPNNSSFESLLYDFSLEIGDTVPYSYGFTNCASGNIYSVDSFNFGSQIRKRLFVNATNLRTGGVRIYQGIGANCGLLGEMCIYYDGIYPCLMSYYNSSDTIQFINCSSISSVIEVENKSTEIVTVNPNPFIDNINYTIMKNNYREVSYCVLSILGETILEMKVNTSSDGSIDLSNLSSGMFFLNVIVDEEQTLIRIVKE